MPDCVTKETALIADQKMTNSGNLPLLPNSEIHVSHASPSKQTMVCMETGINDKNPSLIDVFSIWSREDWNS